jgi:hypothetical protein
MTQVQWLILAAAPGFASLILGTAWTLVQVFRGPSTLAPYRLMALGSGLLLVGMSVWLLLAAAQPWWVKLMGAPVPLVISLPFFGKARRPPHAP